MGRVARRVGRLIALGVGVAAVGVAVVPNGVAHAGPAPLPGPTLQVTKSVLPVDLPSWTVNFTIAPVPPNESATKPAMKGSESVTWNIEEDVEYTITETLPDGWVTNGSPQCEHKQAPVGPSRSPHVAPAQDVDPNTSVKITSNDGENLVCDFFNTAPATGIFTKTALGDGGSEQFTMEVFTCSSLGQNDECIDKTSAVATFFTEGSPASVQLPHGIIRIEETNVPAGWVQTDLECSATDDNGKLHNVIDHGNAVTIEFINQGSLVLCTATNIELGQLTVTKTVVGPSTPWSFEVKITPDPASGPAETGSDSQFVTNLDNTVQWELWPGVNYVVEEIPGNGYAPSAMVCTGDTGPPAPRNGPSRAPHGFEENDNPHDEVNSHYGDVISCTITNTQDLAKLSVTKSVVGGTGDWTFKFKIFPTPPGEANELPATDESPTVTWNNLLPGQQYIVVEEPVLGYSAGALVCTGDTGAPPGPSRASHVVSGGPLFPPEWPNDSVLPAKDDVISCTVTNTATHADLSITKTADVEQSGLDGTVVWTLHVVNNGATASGVVVNDTLPLDLQLVSVSAPGGWDCTESAPGSPAHVGCKKASMAPGESADIIVTTEVIDLGAVELENCAFAGARTPETNYGNNSGCDSILIEDLPETGSESSPTAWVGFGLLGLGALFTMITRRRKHARA